MDCASTSFPRSELRSRGGTDDLTAITYFNETKPFLHNQYRRILSVEHGPSSERFRQRWTHLLDMRNAIQHYAGVAA